MSYLTSTPFPGFAPGELLDTTAFADLADLSPFTVRTQWKEYGMPFELMGGRLLCTRASAEHWIAERARKEIAKLSDKRAEAMWLAMQERRAAR